MDYLTNPMQVVKTHQALFRHYPDEWHGNTFIVISLDYFKQIDPQNLKHKDKMFSMLTMVQEAIKQLHAVAVVSSNIVQLSFVDLVAIVLL